MNICIIKAGSAIVTQDKNILDLNAIQNICHQIIKLNENGWKVVLISSGAAASGKGSIRSKTNKKSMTNSVFAALGQGKLISYYSSFINTNNSNLDVGQVLVTRKSLSSRTSFNDLKDVIFGLIDNDIIPIINENDVLRGKGIGFTDNDQLAAIITTMLNAKCCILLSEVGAIYNKNPNLYNDAYQLDELDFDNNIDKIKIDDRDSSRGGMKSKIDVFKTMNTFRSECILIGKENISDILDVINKKIKIGTHLKLKDKKRYNSVQKWLGTAAMPKGIVIISPLGASVMSGKSEKSEKTNLYSIGICGYLGQFDKGDIVSVRDEELNLIGIGKSKSSTDDLKRGRTGSVFIRETEFFQADRYTFVDADMLNIKQTLAKLRKKLLKSDDTKFVIVPISGDMDLSRNEASDDAIVVQRIDVEELVGLYRYAKTLFKLTFDEWLIYSSLEGYYKKSDINN